MDFVRAKSSARSPTAVLAAIDEYARTQKYLMNVGDDKGRIVTDLIRETKPQAMLELGGYCGYSTILFADAQRQAGGSRYYSLERSPKFAKNIEALVAMAGLSDFVEVVVGPSDQGIKKLHESGKVKKIDMMFLDHYKPAYTIDLKLCESLGMIQKGSVLAADNVVAPGNPPYLAYVRSSVKDKIMKLSQEARTDTENFPGQSATQYGDVERLSTEVKGNPRIVYESRLVDSFEPTGEPVSLPSRSLGFNNTKCRNRTALRLRNALELTRRILELGNPDMSPRPRYQKQCQKCTYLMRLCLHNRPREHGLRQHVTKAVGSIHRTLPAPTWLRNRPSHDIHGSSNLPCLSLPLHTSIECAFPFRNAVLLVNTELLHYCFT